jgi:MFS superfamily sulfate permease-like transporter
VLLGFKAGVALHLASTQLPKLFGFGGAHGGDFWDRVHHFFAHLSETNSMALAYGGISLAIILAGKQFWKNKPVALFVMIGGIVAATLMHVNDHGVKLLGPIPKGLPPLAVPDLAWSEVRSLLPLAVACFMLSAVENAAIGRMFALKHGYRLNANQEFLALAATNLASGFGQGYAVGGGMSQSLVNESGGAKTSLSGLFAALIVLVIVVFFSDLLHNLPQAVLAAIVLAAVTGLFKVKELAALWRFSKGEFGLAMAALAGVLFFGLLQGVMIGALLSILALVRRASRPNTSELGRVPGSNYFADRDRHPENARVPGALVFRPSAALVYFNVEHVRDRFNELLAEREDPIRTVVFFMGAVPMVDLAGAELLVDLYRQMKAKGITFRLAEAHGPVRDALRRAGYESHCGPVQANQTVAEVLAELLPEK